MRIKGTIGYESGGDPWTEAFDSGEQDPQEYMEHIVSEFNRTLRPEEKRRKLIGWTHNKRPLVWMVEDDADSRAQYERDIPEALPGVDLVLFDAAFRLMNATGSPDMIIIDVAGASGVLSAGTDWEQMTSCIHTIVESHPGANYGFFSAVESYAKDVVEEFKEDSPEMVAEFIDSWDIDNFINFIKKWSE